MNAHSSNHSSDLVEALITMFVLGVAGIIVGIFGWWMVTNAWAVDGPLTFWLVVRLGIGFCALSAAFGFALKVIAVFVLYLLD